jgi:signal transduction histidine kinase
LYSESGSKPHFTAVTTFTICNGAEIPQAHLSRLFEKFYRVPQPDIKLGGGMGLGLALVQKLVEHLQSTIKVESSQGWTTFTVCFPNWQVSKDGALSH